MQGSLGLQKKHRSAFDSSFHLEASQVFLSELLLLSVSRSPRFLLNSDSGRWKPDPEFLRAYHANLFPTPHERCRDGSYLLLFC